MGSYLVTGGAGFIGSAIAKKLIQSDNKVVIIDNLSTGIIENIPHGAVFYQGDVADDKIIDQLHDEKFDAIIHFAGQSSGEISFDDPVYDLNCNVCSTLKLLHYAKRNNIRKFIYASSMSVYGDHFDNSCVTEKSLTKPKSFYAVGKLASENYLEIYARQYGISCTVLRLFNVYGIGQNLFNLRQGMASIFLTMAIRNHHIFVKGRKDRFRDFVYIDDVVNAVCGVLKYTENKFDIFNVCCGKIITVEQVINEICRNLPYSVTVEYGTGTPGDQHGIYGDFNEIQQKIGWIPQVNFTDGINKMVNWAIHELKK